jgi:hypothetical protein
MWWNQLLVATCLVVCYYPCWIKEVVESSGWQCGWVFHQYVEACQGSFCHVLFNLGGKDHAQEFGQSYSRVQRYRSTLSWSLKPFSLYLRFSDTFRCEARIASSFDIAALEDQNQCGTYNGVYFWWAIHSHRWETFSKLYIKRVKSENPDENR